MIRLYILVVGARRLIGRQTSAVVRTDWIINAERDNSSYLDTAGGRLITARRHPFYIDHAISPCFAFSRPSSTHY